MISKLTNRELEVLKLIINELTSEEIANELYVSGETVKSHRQNIRNKMRVRNVAGMVRKALELNLVEI